MRTTAKRILAILFSGLLAMQVSPLPDAAAMDDPVVLQILEESGAATPEEQTVRVQSGSVTPDMLNAQARGGRVFTVKWLPDDSVAPQESLEVIATWGEQGTQTQTVSAASGWSCTFSNAPADQRVTYTLPGLDADKYYDYPSDGKDFITVSEMAETPVIKKWYNTPEVNRLPINVTVTMVSGESGGSGGTGGVLGHITGLDAAGKGNAPEVLDQDAFRFPRFNSDGKAFHSFTVQEFALESPVINLDGRQEYKAGETITLHNTIERALKVTKVWPERTDYGMDSVTVCLIRVGTDGGKDEVLQELTLTRAADGSWPTAAFAVQPMGGKVDGVFQPYTFRVEEKGVFDSERPGENFLEDFDVRYPAAPNWLTSGFAVENTRKVDEATETTVRITKTWDDARENGFRYASFTVTRLNGGDAWFDWITVTSTENNTMTVQKRYPKYNTNGEEYLYHVQEDDSADFYSTFQKKETDATGTTWHFLNQSVKRSVTVEKKWFGDDPALRPPVTLYLLRDGQRVKDPDTQQDISITLPPGETTHTFNDLDRFTGRGGRAYDYTVEEAPLDGYYTVERGLIVENHKKEDGGDAIILITKRWQANGKQYDVFPSVALQLYQRVGGGQPDQPVGAPIITTEGISLSQMFTILSGQGVTLDPAGDYYVRETTDSGGKWIAGDADIVWNGAVGTAVITNVLQRDLIERKPTFRPLVVRKIWQVSGAPGGFDSVEAYIATLPSTFTLIQSIDGVETDELSAEIVKLGGSGSYDAGAVRITGNGYISLNVPEYDAQGRRYTYRVKETASAGLRISSFVSDYTHIFTNAEDTFPIKARKTWENLFQRGNASMPPVTLQLHQRVSGGSWLPVGAPQVINGYTRGGSGIDYTMWAEVALGSFPTHVYADGEFKPCEYKVTEAYDLTDKRYFVTTGLEVENGLADIRNTYNSNNVKTTFTVNKDWMGGTRGETYPPVTIELYADGVRIDSVELTAGSAVAWSHTFRDLDIYRGGEGGAEIVYTAKEVAIGGKPIDPKTNSVAISTPEGDKVYKHTNSYMMGDNDYYATNTLVTLPKDLRYDIIGYKAWGDLPDGTKLPDQVVFALHQDGQFYGRETLTAPDWSCVFENVPYYNTAEGRPYTYLLFEEDPPAGFYPLIKDAMVFDRDKDGALYAHATLINIPTQEQEITLVKEWKGDGGNPALRVDENGEARVALTLAYGGGTRQVILTPDANDVWSATVSLPVTTKQGGTEYVVYELIEPTMPNYAWAENRYEGVTALSDRTFRLNLGEKNATVTVVNAMHTSTSITGIKKWVDGGNAANTRPQTLSVQLERYVSRGGVLEDQLIVGTFSVAPGDGNTQVSAATDPDLGEVGIWQWTYTVDKFSPQGEPYVYKWKETVPAGYRTMAVDDQYSYLSGTGVKAMVNRLDTVDVRGDKAWINTLNGTDFGAIHPTGELTIQLMRSAGGGQAMPVTGYTQTVSAAKGWSWHWKGLPRVDAAGQPYTYSVREETSVPGYETNAPAPTEDNGVITADLENALRPGKLLVRKAWHADGPGTGRASIEVELSAQIGGKKHTWTRTLSEAGGWEAAFENLPVYDSTGGTTRKINYTLREMGLPAGYEMVTLLIGGTEEFTVVSDATLRDILLGDDGSAEVTLVNARLIELTVTKEWIDGGNASQTRPGSLWLTLQRRRAGGTYAPYDRPRELQPTAQAGNAWTLVWPDKLVEYAPDGTRYEYQFVEATPPDGYTARVDRAAANSGDAIVNALAPMHIVVLKDGWGDAGHESETRPDEVAITLTGTAAGEAPITRTGKLTPPTWRETFDDMPRYLNGKPITYAVTETVPAGYIDGPYNDGSGVKTYPAIRSATEGGTLTFRIENRLALIEVIFTKRWSEGAHLGKVIRPKTITLDLWRTTGTPGDKTDPSATRVITGRAVDVPASGDTFTVTFPGLRASGGSSAFAYWAEERPVEGYALAAGENTLDITNALMTVDIRLTKAWQDVAEADRPGSVEAILIGTAHGREVYRETHTLRAADGWTLTVDDLPRYAYAADRLNAALVAYTVKETPHAAYEVTIDDAGMKPAKSGDYSATLTNNLRMIDITVRKIFAGDQATIKAGFSPRPQSVTILLHRATAKYGPDAGFEASKTIDSITGGMDSYTVIFTGLRACDNEGNAYIYTADEAPVGGYAKSLSPDGLTVTNTLETIRVWGTKKWMDTKDGDGEYPLRPASVLLTLTRTAGGVADAFRMEQSIAYDKAATEQGWAFDDLPRYSPDGTDYVYAVTETPVPGYDTAYAETPDGVNRRITITNTLRPLEIVVEKRWQGDEGYKEYRPKAPGLEIRLLGTGQDGKVYCDSRQRVTAPAGGGDVWTVRFENLRRYGEDGKLITYTVSEEPLAAYAMAAITQPQVDDDLSKTSYTATITNALRTVKLTGQKDWEDNNNRYRTRPASITIALMRRFIDPTTGSEAVETVRTEQISAPWRWDFGDLPAVHTNFSPLTYFVEEVTKDGRYMASQPENDPMSLTNTLITQQIIVEKRWEDENDRYRMRPATVTIELLSSTGVRYTGAISSVRNWTFVFSGLPKYTQAGELVTYTLSETLPPGYRIKGSITQPVSSAEDTYRASITNELITTQASVRKEWRGGSAPYPAVTIWLMDSNRRVDSVTLREGSWSHTFAGLPRHRADGAEIAYTLREEPVQGYASSVARTVTADGVSFVVVNTREPDPTPIPTPTPTTTPPGVTPTPTATRTSVPPRRSYVTVEDPPVPLGIGEVRNLGECYE